MDKSSRLSGEDWQNWVDKLLTLHFGISEYQRVPDHQRGDAGIEGYSISSGCVYQAYGPEEPLTTKELYDKQRNKITNDIKKFIENKDILISILGSIKIKRWILVVPRFESKDLLSHAWKKANEVINANLPYVDTDFKILIQDENSFEIERNKLLNLGVGDINILPEEVTSARITEWADKSDRLVSVLDDKISHLSTIKTDAERKDFRNKIIQCYLEGQNLLEELRMYPLEYEKIIQIKSQQAKYLSIETKIREESEGKMLASCIDKMKDSVKESVPSVGGSTIDVIAMQAVSEWMILCPLNFK